MKPRATVPVFLLALVAGAAPARAQRAPDLATLDRGDGITKIGLDFGLTFLDVPPYDLAFRLEPHGQYVLSSGFGFYGALPLAASSGDDDDPPGDQDAAAIGNLDLGLLYVIDSPTLSWVFRGGVGLPTADDDLDGSLTNFFAGTPRLTDFALTIPDTFYIRLGVSPLIHLDKIFLRADLGFDLGIDDNDAGQELIRVNLGGGYDFGVVALSLELANLITLDDFGGEDFLHTLAVTARFMTRYLEPFLTVGTPLDSSARGAVSLFVAAGIQIPFR